MSKSDVPLATMLSQALVAYTIEFDDVAEQRIYHGTMVGSREAFSKGGVWFSSQVMWTNFIRHLDTKGRPVREVQALACLPENIIKSRLHHLEWWFYLTFAPGPKDTRSKPRYLDQLVLLTPGGAKAAQQWRPISAEVDKRWAKRLGKPVVDRLTTSLRKIVAKEGANLPDHMPVVDYGDGMRAALVQPAEQPARTAAAKLDLSALISRVLLVVTLEFEKRSEVSLTASANVLRVIEDKGSSLKDLPLAAGVAKEGQIALVNFLKKKGYLTIGSDKAKTLKLTAKGKKAKADAAKSLAAIERRLEKTCGRQTVDDIRKGLDTILSHKKFVDGLTPHEGGWRLDKRYVKQTEAVLADPRGALPHHPMITHRGGFPDGS